MKNDVILRAEAVAPADGMTRLHCLGSSSVSVGVVSSLAADGAAQAAVVGIVVWENERTVQLDGLADEPTGADLQRLREVYFAVYPDVRERLAWPGLTHFRIVPSWARFSDFAVAPQPLILELSGAAAGGADRG